MNELLSIVREISNTLLSLDIDKTKYQKLYNLITEINYNILNNQFSIAHQKLNKVVQYITYDKGLARHKTLMLSCNKYLKYIAKTFPLTKEEEVLEIAIQELLKNKITLEEYETFILPKETKDFDGRLTEYELELLYTSGFSEKEIKYIVDYVEKYKNSLSGYKDLVGDTLIPDKKMFLFLIKHFGYLMSNDPEEVISEQGILIRKMLNPLIKSIGKNFLKNGQFIENREILIKNFDNNIPYQSGIKRVPDKGIILPEEPVIWVANHGFKDDTLATILACLRHAYILFGNCAQFYNTFDGILSHLNGIFQCNRKSQMSKKASVKKGLKTLSLGSDLVVFPEAIWNKSPNKLALELWSGFYTLAKESGYKVVPMVHYIKDATHQKNPIHTVIDDPIDIAHLTEKEAKEYLTEIFSTWQIMMMNSYGRSTRDKELEGFASPHEAWETHLKNLVKDVNRFDSEAEHFADFRSLDRECFNSEKVWEPITRIIPEKEREDNEIYKLVKTLKEEDYQRRI